MADKLGINPVGLSKLGLAGAVLEAKKKAGAKGISKPKPIGKKNVLAKRAAIDAQIKENEEVAAKLGAGVKELQNRNEEFQNEIREFQYG